MILGNEWDGTRESAEWTHRELNAVIDTLMKAGMWTGNPPYQGKTAAQQVQMLIDAKNSPPIAAISKLVGIVCDEWGETEPTNIVGEWLDKQKVAA